MQCFNPMWDPDSHVLDNSFFSIRYPHQDVIRGSFTWLPEVGRIDFTCLEGVTLCRANYYNAYSDMMREENVMLSCMNSLESWIRWGRPRLGSFGARDDSNSMLHSHARELVAECYFEAGTSRLHFENVASHMNRIAEIAFQAARAANTMLNLNEGVTVFYPLPPQYPPLPYMFDIGSIGPSYAPLQIFGNHEDNTILPFIVHEDSPFEDDYEDHYEDPEPTSYGIFN